MTLGNTWDSSNREVVVDRSQSDLEVIGSMHPSTTFSFKREDAYALTASIIRTGGDVRLML